MTRRRTACSSRQTTIHEAALDVAITHWYWKPGVCLIRALELNAYLSAACEAEPPCLDLGCGDGQVSRALLDARVARLPIVGLDLSRSQLAKARVSGHYANLIRASATRMPFRNEHFESVICNGVLEALPDSPEQAVREAARILKRGGLFLLTVPTARFIPVMFWPRVLAHVSASLSNLYVRAFNERLEHRAPYLSMAEWRRHLEAAGFRVEHEQSFLSRRAGMAYNLLVMQVFRPLQLVRAWGSTPPNVVRRVLRRILERVCAQEGHAHQDGGYALFVARRL